jgi:hypothetical protein
MLMKIYYSVKAFCHEATKNFFFSTEVQQKTWEIIVQSFRVIL